MKFHFRERGNPEIEEGPKTSRERLLENLEKKNVNWILPTVGLIT